MKIKQKNQFKILIVDDEESIVNFLKATMEDEGFKVFHATNPVDAIEICRANQPNLVMLDLRMPSMDGLEVLKRIREQDANRNILIVMISAYGADLKDSDRELLKQLDVKDFIPKGVSLQEAKERIFKVIEENYKIS